MKIIVARNNRPGSWLIRLVTMGQWSHAALLLPNGLVIDTTLTTGVRSIPVMAWIRDYPTHQVIDIDVPDEEQTISFAMAQLRKPYDWTAIFGILLRRNWQEPDAWFCSELVEAALAAGGRQRFRDDVSRITPHQTWSVM